MLLRDDTGKGADEMKTWKLGFDGYVMQYMISGPSVKTYKSDLKLRDQLETEAQLRKEISSKKPDSLLEHFLPGQSADGKEAADDEYKIKVGSVSPIGEKWKVYAPHNNCFIDVSKFYSTLQNVKLDAATDLIADEDMEVKARVWSYMSVGVYLRNRKIGDISHPVYKPMQCIDLKLTLRKGANRVYFVCENLGARDTRNILGFQILESEEMNDKISVSLPDVELQDSVYEAERYLAEIDIKGDNIILPGEADDHITVRKINKSPDYYRDRTQYEIPSKGMKQIPVDRDISTVKISIEKESFSLTREIEFSNHLYAKRNDEEFLRNPDSYEKNLYRMHKSIATVKSLDRGEFGFSIMNVLSRRFVEEKEAELNHTSYALSDYDRELLLKDMDSIEERVDCADFLICGFIRYIHNYEMDEQMSARLKEVLLGFRYWMNEEGSDAMCFWSENHSLMFYSSAMFVGAMYPDDYFPRAEKTGRELSLHGRKKVIDWIIDVEQYGFEEFLSNVYVNVTLAALLNLIDYGDKEISGRITVICDRMLRSLCLQCFKGTLIAPMGRVYREILYPFMGGTQALINAIDPSAPYCFGEGWMAYLATTGYKFPEDCRTLMAAACEEEYTSGNACIRLKKTEDYMLTSVQSPRTDGWTRWTNIRLGIPKEKHINHENVDTDSHEYNKALNESFHGTSLFTPGTHGYQQHMWMAALDDEAVVFVNHPGTTSEFSDMRPGYWNGNGVMPAIMQKGKELLSVYSIPDKDPIHFIHMYCPADRFDEVRFSPTKSGDHSSWMFLRKGTGYMAVWISVEVVSHSEKIYNSEFRIYSRNTGCYVKMGSYSEDGDFDQFCSGAKQSEPVFEEQTLTLITKSGMELSYQAGNDETQYID